VFFARIPKSNRSSEDLIGRIDLERVTLATFKKTGIIDVCYGPNYGPSRKNFRCLITLSFVLHAIRRYYLASDRINDNYDIWSTNMPP